MANEIAQYGVFRFTGEGVVVRDCTASSFVLEKTSILIFGLESCWLECIWLQVTETNQSDVNPKDIFCLLKEKVGEQRCLMHPRPPGLSVSLYTIHSCCLCILILISS